MYTCRYIYIYIYIVIIIIININVNNNNNIIIIIIIIIILPCTILYYTIQCYAILYHNIVYVICYIEL